MSVFFVRSDSCACFEQDGPADQRAQLHYFRGVGHSLYSLRLCLISLKIRAFVSRAHVGECRVLAAVERERRRRRATPRRRRVFLSFERSDFAVE